MKPADLVGQALASLTRETIEKHFSASGAHWADDRRFFTVDPLKPSSGTVFTISTAGRWLRGVGGKGNEGDVVALLAARDGVSIQTAAARLLGVEAPDTRPTINTTEMPDITVQSDQAGRALGQAQGAFNQEGRPVRVRKVDNTLRVEPLTVDSLRHHLALTVRFVKADLRSPSRVREIPPPLDAVRDLLARPDIDRLLPKLTGVKTVPFFDSDGRLVNRSGYDAGSGYYLDIAPSLEGLEVPEATPEAVTAAVDLIDELIHDFPLDTPADRAAAFTFLLTLLSRPMIAGNVPLFMVSAPAPGTGKTLLVSALVIAALGTMPPLVGECADPAEFSKTLLAILMGGPDVVNVDNLSTRVDSGVLAMIVTSGTYQARILGATAMVSVRVLSTIVLSLNNPSVSNELARRSVPIRMVPASERPWQRTGFLHDNLTEWVTERRPDIVKGCLVLVKAWLEAGRPKPSARPLGSFEAWSHVVGGILETAEVKGFLENLDGFHGQADEETATWTLFLSSWHAEHDSRLTRSADLVPLALKAGVVDEGRTDRATQTTLGRALSRMADRVFGELRIVRGTAVAGSQMWKVHPASAVGHWTSEDIFYTPRVSEGSKDTYRDSGEQVPQVPDVPSTPVEESLPEPFKAALSTGFGVF